MQWILILHWIKIIDLVLQIKAQQYNKKTYAYLQVNHITTVYRHMVKNKNIGKIKANQHILIRIQGKSSLGTSREEN